MAETIQRGLRALGIFLSGAFTGILIFMIWAEHQGILAAKPALRLAMFVGTPLALFVTFIPGLLSEVVTGINKLKKNNTQNQPPDQT